MVRTRILDLCIVALYFAAMTAMGWYFRRRTKTTEQYFVGNRAYPGWLLGVSLFGAAISSITFVAYPADAFKTASGDVEGSLRLICEKVHGYGDVRVGRKGS
jgi:Na+/proline symporter